MGFLTPVNGLQMAILCKYLTAFCVLWFSYKLTDGKDRKYASEKIRVRIDGEYNFYVRLDDKKEIARKREVKWCKQGSNFGPANKTV